MFVALDKAIRDRLAGNPRNKHGMSMDPVNNPGIRIPMFQRNLTNDPRTEQFNPFKVVPNAFNQIPIYNTSLDGVTNRNTYPAVTYDFISYAPRLDQWLPPTLENRIAVPQATAPDVTLVNRYGQVIDQGYSANVSRPFAESYNVMVQMDVYSQIEYEAMLILRGLFLLFPQKGAITVAQADGTQYVCDMLMQESAVTSLYGEPSLEEQGGLQDTYREYRHTVTYVVEAYIDTTWPNLTTQTPAVRDVKLEQTFTDVHNAANIASSDGVLEVIDVKDTF